MSSITVNDQGEVTVFLTLSAMYSNETTEPLLETKTVQVPRDHAIVSGALDIWHLTEDKQAMWHEDPMDNVNVEMFMARLYDVIAEFFA
jgi:hypothetical protein